MLLIMLYILKKKKKYYNEQALRAKKDEIRSLFLMLSSDEDRHYKIIEKFKEGVYKYLPTETFKNVPTLFNNLKNKNIDLSDDEDLWKVYEKAINIEIKPRIFTNKTRLKSNNPKEKEIWD